MKSKSKDVILLLGAGASVEAGVPSSQMMIEKIEQLLKTKGWDDFSDLYNQIKSAIHYAKGIQGVFDHTFYNIETLVNTLYELERNEEHPIYPFIATWNSRLTELAGPNFRKVADFRDKIIEALQSWVQPEDADADYYQGLKRLQGDLQFPLKVFSLNYDLCVEALAAEGFRIETGFTGVGKGHTWEWKRFDDSNPDNEPPEVYLYKMHGSINWKRDENGNLICVQYSGSNIRPNEMQVIFGRDLKLEAADPYLFYTFEFRRCSLEARLIVAIGYGFGDPHINKILSQALRSDSTKRLIVIGNSLNKDEAESRAAEIRVKLDGQTNISVLEGRAKAFFTNLSSADVVKSFLPPEPAVEF